MPEQSNKPGGEEPKDAQVRPAGDRQAVKNQGEVRPEDYPDKADGAKAIGGEDGDGGA